MTPNLVRLWERPHNRAFNGTPHAGHAIFAAILALMIAAKAKTAKCASTKKPREYSEESTAYDCGVFLLQGYFTSAITLPGKTDGADSQQGEICLELAEFIMCYGARPEADLRELWRCIVFTIAASNTDDHLRHHGFLLEGAVG